MLTFRSSNIQDSCSTSLTTIISYASFKCTTLEFNYLLRDGVEFWLKLTKLWNRLNRKWNCKHCLQLFKRHFLNFWIFKKKFQIAHITSEKLLAILESTGNRNLDHPRYAYINKFLHFWFCRISLLWTFRRCNYWFL